MPQRSMYHSNLWPCRFKTYTVKLHITYSTFCLQFKQKTDGRSKPWLAVFWLCVMLCITSYGCATMQIPDYPKPSSNALKREKSINNLNIAIHPITDKQELEQYFGTDLSEAQILPVYVLADNKSSSSSFLLSKDYIALQQKKTSYRLKTDSGSVTGRSQVGEIVALTGAALVSIPLLFGGIKAISNAEVVKQNLAAKALQTRTVSPGKSVDGFVYFKLPDKTTPLADWAILLDVKELGNNSMHEFVLTLE